jgi:ATP-binding cassette subfamily B protein
VKNNQHQLVAQAKQYLSLEGLYKPLQLLMPFLAKHWKAHVGLLVLVFAEIGLTLMTAWLMGTMTDAAINQQRERLAQTVPIAIILALLNIAAGYIGIHLQLLAETRLKKDLQEYLFRHILLLPAKHTNQSKSGELLTHFSQDIHGVEGMIGTSLVQLLRLPLIFIAAFVYMLQIHWMLACISAIAAPFIAIFGGLFGILLRSNSRKMYDQVSQMNTFITESIQGLSVIRSFTLEKRVFAKFYGQSEQLYGYERRDAKLRGIYSAFGQAAGTGIFLFCLSLGAYLVASKDITVGSMVAFLNLTGHLVYPLTGLAGLWIGFQKSLPAVERLVKVLDRKVEYEEFPDFIPTSRGGKSIRFEDITFSYDGEINIFEQFNLTVAAGQTAAIVGHSGAGKSTLFNLLQGLYKADAGVIYVDDKRADQLSPSELRSSMALVSQDTFLFDGTIRDNLLLARPDISEEDMVNAAHQANLHEFIQSLPKGFDTEVGERGVRLSGGQKQRVAILRAILKNASILLLDEATSALDSESEFQVREALERLKSGRTTVIIAHRLSTVYQADIIIVLEQGKIVQTGRHTELAAREGAYQRLIRRQYFNGEDEQGEYSSKESVNRAIEGGE